MAGQIFGFFLLEMNLYTISLKLVQTLCQVPFLLSYSEGTKISYFKRLILSGYQQKRMLDIMKLLHD